MTSIRTYKEQETIRSKGKRKYLERLQQDKEALLEQEEELRRLEEWKQLDLFYEEDRLP
jgi:hypothetical protein